MNEASVLIIGANGQLGRALQDIYPDAQKADIDELDITDRDSVLSYDWSRVSVIINAAAYTNVDGAETPEGKDAARKVNSQAVELLAEVATKHELTLVHISTDYVFDGTRQLHAEDEPFSPLNEYGKSKAAGDEAAAKTPMHYILRTSWVIGDGNNFVRTMLRIGKDGKDPEVIADQIGRLTFTTDLVGAIDHLLTNEAPYGTYNVSGEGDSASWAEITRAIYKVAGLPNQVTDTTTSKYYTDKPGKATRPLNSTLDLSKIEATGFKPRDWRDTLSDYVKKEMEK